MKSIRRSMQRGFTLVELLIVVIILALLAAIVVPQFSSSTDDAKEAALDSTLANVRAAIDLYYQQHTAYPGAVTAVPTDTCDGTQTGTGNAGTALAFEQQMTWYTNKAGGACSKKDANFKYGPYLKQETLPGHPITGDATLVIVTDGDLNMIGADPADGWKFDTVIGKFIADDIDRDDR